MSERDPLGIAGQTIADKYRIDKLVGEGGFALVYRAIHAIWNKPVAIKFFNGLSSAPLDQRAQLTDAFIQEGALLTELSSHTAAIVQARDVGTYTSPDGQWMPYMVLEWLEGKPLEELLEGERARAEAPWSVAQVVKLLGQGAGALDVAHGKGIAHRDIKPANLFVLGDDARGGTATLKVLDFGVAKLMTDNTQLKAALAKTGTSVTSFTPQYGAPEQFNRAYGATGPWTDVYALALVAVEMLSGRVALDGDDLVQLAFASSNPERRPTPRALGVSVSDAVEHVFRRALSVRPDERYTRAREFWGQLEAAEAGSLSLTVPQPSGAASPSPHARSAAGYGTPPSSEPTTPRTAPKKSAGALLGGLALLAVVASGALLLLRPPAASSGPPLDHSSPRASSSPPERPLASPAPVCPDEMVLIPAGQFFMGSDAKDANANQKPSHQVTLQAFCIDLYEVTARKYKECSAVGKCKRGINEVDWPGITPADRAAYSPLCTLADAEKGEHPVNCVDWEQASTYCKNNDKRLPSEAEWEYATRGPDGRVYPWGDDEPTASHLNACGLECLAWAKQNKVAQHFPGALYQAEDGFATTAPVGRFPAGRSRFGPYDVVGNVWEWVADWDGAYGPTEQQNPTGPASGEKRVLRGGAWNGSLAEWLRPAFRYAQAPGARSHGVGFRCARAPQL
jgi:eukaryotic-like serine/threonine-protein kinase